MPFDFSADHVAAQAGGFEPQRLNHFTITIAGVGQSEVIQQSLMSFQPPHREIAEVVIPYGNEDRKVAGKVTVTEASMTIVDYVDKDTWKDFNDWLDKVHDPKTGNIGWASEYKKEATVRYYGPKMGNPRAWRIIGCWPKSVSPEQFSMDSGEKNQLTVPLACDKCVPDGQA